MTESGHITALRSFNRLITRRIGALTADYLSRGRPLGEARVIYEIGAGAADIKSLRARLQLDSGYLSRMLKSLDTQGLVLMDASPDDRRVHLVRLTAKGKRERAAYDKLSDRLAQAMLEPLRPAEQDRLVAALATAERLLRMAEIEISEEDPESKMAQHCLGEYYRELAARFEGGFDPANYGSGAAIMRPPLGQFSIAWCDGVPAGCGALVLHRESRIAEIRRMWVDPAARGQGVASRILRHLEDAARRHGCKRLRLDTNRVLKEAQAMYRKAGYSPIPRFNDNPYAHHWFVKKL